MRMWFEVLGVSPQASPEEVKDAWHKIAKASHPDIIGSDEKIDIFDAAKKAYQAYIKPQAEPHEALDVSCFFQFDHNSPAYCTLRVPRDFVGVRFVEFERSVFCPECNGEGVIGGRLCAGCVGCRTKAVTESHKFIVTENTQEKTYMIPKLGNNVNPREPLAPLFCSVVKGDFAFDDE